MYCRRTYEYGPDASVGIVLAAQERICRHSELVHDLAAVSAAEGQPHSGVDAVADELDVTVAEQRMDAARVSAASSDI